MPEPKSHSYLQSAFRQWALKKVLEGKGRHPLQCLVDKQTGTWYKNGPYSDVPSLDAGHMTSKWTGAPAVFALEDTDFNRLLNRGENKTRHGVVYKKTAVLIGGVPVESRTAGMLQRTEVLAPGILEGAPSVKGAEFSRSGEFEIRYQQKLVPTISSNMMPGSSVGTRLRNAASNQDGVVLLIGGVQSLMLAFEERNVAVDLEAELKTTRAKEIAAIRASNEGVLVIARVLRNDDPIRMDSAQLHEVFVQGGKNHEDAVRRWHAEPHLYKGAASVYRVDVSYIWLGK